MGTSLEDISKHVDWIAVNELQFGRYVADYFIESSPGIGIFCWLLTDRLCILEESCNVLNNILTKRQLSVINNDDEIIWCASKSHRYNVKLNYMVQVTIKDNKDGAYRLCWDKLVAPRAGTFLWMVKHYRILTREKLKTYGIFGPTICVMCKSGEKTTGHLLYDCPFVK
ncbi:hypothetical protein SUGI_0174700 [Cryptomeria japonica]|nr:hypothetical protein SUGI_0174700 [Cryptomeria japonica]